MTFLDTGIIVGAVLQSHPEHEACLAALERFRAALHECAGASGGVRDSDRFYRVPSEAACELTLGLRAAIAVEALGLADHETSIREARSRGVMGGGIYDSLHATFARRKKAIRIVTRNPSHFEHVAPDIEILTP